MRSSIDGSIEVRFIENYDFQIFRSEIRLKLMYLFRVSFLTTPDIYIYIYIERERERERREWAFALLLKKIQHFAKIFKLIREMPLF